MWQGLFSAVSILFAGQVLAQTPKPVSNSELRSRKPANSEAAAVPGLRIENYKEFLKTIYPEATDFQEHTRLPAISGGSTFMGLVARLLGEYPNSEHEGMRVRRYIYHAIKGKEVIGVAHGSAINGPKGPIDFYIFYNGDGTIRQVKADKLPDSIERKLLDKGYLSQFTGYKPEDFEKQRGRKRGRYTVGSFLSKAKKPASGEELTYFNKIVRAARFNASFMDVAYFITQHPDLADKESDVFENTPIAAGVPMSGPEAFVRDRVSSSPFEGKAQLLQPLKPNED